MDLIFYQSIYKVKLSQWLWQADMIPGDLFQNIIRNQF